MVVSQPLVGACLTALLLLGQCCSGARGTPTADTQAPHDLLSHTPHAEQSCADTVPPALLEGLNLTASERELLHYLCWPAHEDGEQASSDAAAAAGAEPPPRGVPAGVNCTQVDWCAHPPRWNWLLAQHAIVS